MSIRDFPGDWMSEFASDETLHKTAPYDFSSLKDKNIGVVGATGAVGAEFLKIFLGSNIPHEKIRLFASQRSAGRSVDYLDGQLIVHELNESSFAGLDIAFFSAGSSVSKKYREVCLGSGAVLIDNSSAFRMEEGVPLVIPEVNPGELKNHSGLIANPNCSTIIMLMAVYPIHKNFPVDQIVVSTYQAASGAGWSAMEELKKSTRAFLNGQEFQPQVFPFSYAFNLFSHDSSINDSGFCEEELKMIYETQKILNDPGIKVNPTCIRVPVLRAHCESIYLSFIGEPPSVREAMDCLESFPGIRIVNDEKRNHFPMPLESSEKYDCLVGRVRRDLVKKGGGIHLFVSGDQLLKGAALNAVQIAALV